MLTRRQALAHLRAEAVRDSAAAVILVQDGKVLLLRRGPTAPWMPGKWNLPGGTMDEGETPAQTAAREAEEEVSVKVSGLRKLTHQSLPDFDLTVFITSKFSGQPRMTWENSEMRWVTPEEALKLDLVPGLTPALSKAAAELR